MTEEQKHTRKQAVALSYDPVGDGAPKVVAKGKGKIADNILEQALENDIPVQEDASLVELLGQLNIDEAIPEQLYQAVSEVFAYIYHVDRNYGLRKR